MLRWELQLSSRTRGRLASENELQQLLIFPQSYFSVLPAEALSILAAAEPERPTGLKRHQLPAGEEPKQAGLES